MSSPEELRPTPEQYQPPLRWWSHAWRVATMLGIGALVWVDLDKVRPPWALVLDVVLGLVCFALVFQRRRHPLAVAVLTSVASIVSVTAAGPATLALVSVATRRRWRDITVAGLVNLASVAVYTAVMEPELTEPLWVATATNVAVIAAVVAWGMYIGSRRELLWTLRQRADRAEAEQELRVDQARLAERSRIAREMHDVLAHRISQISMHAGALAYRSDLSAEEMRSSSAVIRSAAHDALNDLRGVLGVLRGGGEGALAPQPTLADLDALLADAREAGQRVDLVDDLDDTEPLPVATGRTLYRAVQEGITNARKHAPGALLDVRLSGDPAAGVSFVLRNPVGFAGVRAAPSDTPGAGLGLVGLGERVELRGGRLRHTVHRDHFVVRGWIPWGE